MNKSIITTASMQSGANQSLGKGDIPLLLLKSCLFFGAMLCLRNGYSAVYSVEKGKLTLLFNESKTATLRTDGAKSSGQGATLLGFTGAASTAMNSCQANTTGSWSASTSYYTVTTLEGYTGISIASGVLLVPGNLNFQSSLLGANNSTTYAATLTTDEFGTRSVSAGNTASYNPNRWCSTIFSNIGGVTSLSSQNSSGSGNVNWSVYVSSTAVTGTYTIPPLYWTRAVLYGNNGTAYVASGLNGSSVKVVSPMSCTITPPSSIAFGEINITGGGDNQVLAYSGKKNLVVNCLNGVSNPATISVTGTKGRYTDTLKMTMVDDSAKTAPAEIRGFIGKGEGNWPDGICNGSKDYDGYIAFDSSLNQQIPLADNLQPGVNNIPYSFTLCSNTGTNTGSATATATINLTWD